MNTQNPGLVKCEEASCGEGKLPRFWEIEELEERRRLSKCADHCQSDIAFWPWLSDIGNKWGTLGAVLEPEGSPLSSVIIPLPTEPSACFLELCLHPQIPEVVWKKHSRLSLGLTGRHSWDFYLVYLPCPARFLGQWRNEEKTKSRTHRKARIRWNGLSDAETVASQSSVYFLYTMEQRGYCTSCILGVVITHR